MEDMETKVCKAWYLSFIHGAQNTKVYFRPGTKTDIIIMLQIHKLITK